MIIAIDGPAASGKGTLARRLAGHYGLRHLDTGLLYRAAAFELLRANLSLDDEALAERAARSVRLDSLDPSILSAHEVGEAASRISTFPSVRLALVEMQRDFASRPPGAILDGRDIATVICPRADVKLFVTASPETRARRRFEELRRKGLSVDSSAILEDILRRDQRDSNRVEAPMRPASDSHSLDTSGMSAERAFRAAVGIVEAVRKANPQGSALG